MVKMAGLCLLIVTPAFALEPEEIAIIAVRRSPRSRELARFYAERREVPTSQICLIDVEPGVNLDRNEWNRRVRPAIRRWIGANDLQGKLRCLVTTWDVPLKIGRESAVSEDRKLFLKGMRKVQFDRLNDVIGQVREVLTSETVENERLEEETAIAEVANKLQSEFKSAGGRISTEQNRTKATRENQKLSQLFVRTTGVTGLVKQLSNPKQNLNADQAKQLQQLQGRLAGLQEGLLAMTTLPESVSRDEQILGVLLLSGGILKCITWIDQQLKLLQKNETYASFDSELSLIYWPAYPLSRWVSNFEHHRFDGREVRNLRPVLMVSRCEVLTWIS